MMFHRSKSFAFAAGWLCGLMLLAAGSRVVHAQTEQPEQPARWLLVFDTSSAMKKYLPGTEAAVRQFLSAAANGQLKKDDSVGVWSFGRKINSQFKTYNWEPESSSLIVSNLLVYLNQQRYSGDSSLSALQLPLSRVIAGSERLTIVIFCDGESQIHFTPYDDGINQNFHDGLDERKENQQPFVVVVRSQLGKFIGCTVSYPPGNLNLPDFPPLPAPPPAKPPPPKPEVVHKAEPAPLIIVGTKVGTNAHSLTETVPAPPKPAAVAPTNPPAAVKTPAVEKTPVQPAASTIGAAKQVQTNVAAVPVPAAPVSTAITTQATAPVTTPPAASNAAKVVASEKPDRQTGVLILIGVGLLLAALVLVGILVRSARRPRSSLITSSMRDQPPRK